MKRFLLTITFFAFFFDSIAQNDVNRIVVTSFFPTQEDVPAAASKNFESKISQMITSSGMGSVNNSRFAVMPRVIVTDKQVQASVPPMVVMNADVTFYMGDVVTGKVFGSVTKSMKGIGQNDTKAFVSLASSIKPKDPELLGFMETGKQKIIDYYNQNVDQIIKHAQQLASISAYDEALTALFEIPDVCTDAYNRASTHIASIYQQKINYEGEILYNEAYTLWNSTLDYDGAVESCNILSQISPLSSASPKANSLSDKIAKRVKEIDSREWNFKLQQQKNEADITKALINAAAEVAKAEANRPVYNYNVLWW